MSTAAPIQMPLGIDYCDRASDKADVATLGHRDGFLDTWGPKIRSHLNSYDVVASAAVAKRGAINSRGSTYGFANLVALEYPYRKTM